MSIRQREWEARLRLQAFQVEEVRRQVGDIELMIADFRNRQKELETAIDYEEERAGIRDLKDVRYPLAAKEMRKRHANLGSSIADLQQQLEVAMERVRTEEAELERIREAAAREGVDAPMVPGMAPGMHPTL